VRLPKMPYGGGRHAEPVPGAPALETRYLRVSYPGLESPALERLSVRVESGTQVALIGPNGAGKSTLLKTAAGLLEPATGEIRINGNAVGACHHRVAYLPQRGDIDWRFPITVRRLVLTGRYVHLGWFRRPGARDKAFVEEILATLGIGHLAGRQIGRLSGGQQQRVLLARALVQEADLILLDEPLNAVDAETREEISAVTGRLRRAGKTLVVATHDLEGLDRDYDATIRLRNGQLVEPEAEAVFRGPA
jgi:ABC-type Mn2+/Zn2+ transport system ATPase subunit